MSDFASRSQRFPAQPPFTDEGRRIVADWRASHDPIEDDPGKFCQSPGMPSLALGGADYPVEIIVTGTQVTILMEMHQQVRRIFLDETDHPARPFPQRNGHSIGRWDGNTLVVDVTNFNDKSSIAMNIASQAMRGIGQSEQLHVVVRFTIVDENRLDYEVTIEDPGIYTAPWKISMPINRDSKYELYEYACHEGNHALPNTLRGARVQEAGGTKSPTRK